MYKRLLHRRPFLMQALQTGALMGCGDLIAQTAVEKRGINDISVKRSAQFASIGFFVGGPALRLWYGLLHKYVGTSGPTVAIKKVLIDQGVFAPTFLAILLSTVGTMQGKTFETVKKDLRRDYPDVLVTNYYIWPWVQVVNFCIVPLHYQVLVVQVVALFWNTYLSWKTNRTVVVEDTSLVQLKPK